MTASTVATAFCALVFTLVVGFAAFVFAGPAAGFGAFAVTFVLASVVIGDAVKKDRARS